MHESAVRHAAPTGLLVLLASDTSDDLASGRDSCHRRDQNCCRIVDITLCSECITCTKHVTFERTITRVQPTWGGTIAFVFTSTIVIVPVRLERCSSVMLFLLIASVETDFQDFDTVRGPVDLFLEGCHLYLPMCQSKGLVSYLSSIYIQSRLDTNQ